MKRIFSLMLLLILAVSLSINAFAVKLDILNYRDGNTYLEIFQTKDLDEDTYNEFIDLINSSTSLIVYSSDEDLVYFFECESISNVSVNVNADGFTDIFFSEKGTGGFYQAWEPSDDKWYYVESEDIGVGDIFWNLDLVIIGGNIINSIEVGYVSEYGSARKYIADIQGNLIIRYQKQIEDSAEPPEEDEDTESGGILDFLGGFWDKFKTFLVGLFVPSDGFFTDWFNEIKEAFSSKLGAVSNFYDNITGFFDKVTYSETLSEYFPAELWGDLLSWIRRVITGLILFLTFWICYRKIISLLSE